MLSSQTKQPDYLLLTTIFLLLVFGVIMVFSSSYVMAYKWYGNSFYFFNRQLISAIIAVIVFTIAMKIDFHFWRKIAIPVLIISIFLLFLLYVPGLARSIRGAKRWLIIGPVPLQPSARGLLV